MIHLLAGSDSDFGSSKKERMQEIQRVLDAYSENDEKDGIDGHINFRDSCKFAGFHLPECLEMPNYGGIQSY